MSKTAWIIFVAVIVLIFGGLITWSRLSNPAIDVSTIDTNAIIGANDQNGQIADHTLGNTESTVVLVEYGDFQCPSCGGAHPQVKTVMEEYGDDVLFVFRNFPLTTIHPNARAAAAAAEAAGLQNKYWEMHNLLFENQSAWSSLNGQDRTDVFIGYAESIGLDTDQFVTDMSAESVNQKISFDQAISKELGLNSTPTFILNGEQLEDSVSSAIVQGDTTQLTTLLDELLDK